MQEAAVMKHLKQDVCEQQQNRIYQHLHYAEQ